MEALIELEHTFSRNLLCDGVALKQTVDSSHLERWRIFLSLIKALEEKSGIKKLL